ncbi:xylulokinase [Scopulibacillus cellulosilyticus]|uniref:Xylulose kinase n=1 Tax=Scopulibacillus cellulosilyticus TaxID=2665665 RepID=A0ABW2Q1L9_9BACL
MNYVLGIDLGTSSVKVILVQKDGAIVSSSTKEYPLINKQPGYSEQDPLVWVAQTIKATKEIIERCDINPGQIEGLSFSGQMHGLVLLDENNNVLRPAILWNDTRTSRQCSEITDRLGEQLLDITRNKALEGFTLPKLLWVKENEPDIYKKIHKILLPKDYLRFRLTGNIQMEYSDAAGTLMLDIANKCWSQEILNAFNINPSICPELVESTDFTGYVLPDIAEKMNLTSRTKVFAGGADNACGALGANILSEDKAMSSIGTSGVLLSFEDEAVDYSGTIHFFNHSVPNAYYSMGVTLAAGHSLNWLKNTFFENESFEDMMAYAEQSKAGSKGLLFTPYIVGERTPHPDAKIRGSFIGIDAGHSKKDFVRAVLEGITFSLNETLEEYKKRNKQIDTIVSIGGGAKSDLWLQIQADIFNTKVIKLATEEGPSLGAAIIAATGLDWYPTVQDCANAFVKVDKVVYPDTKNVETYRKLFKIYKEIYPSTASINHRLFDDFRVNL